MIVNMLNIFANKDTLRLVLVFITLLSTGSLSNGQFTERPQNLVAVRDTNISLTCETSVTPSQVTIVWQRSNGTVDFKSIAFNGAVYEPGFERYSVVYVGRTVRDTTRSELTLTGVLPTDAGTFRCEAGSNQGYAQLVVFGSDPQVEDNTTMGMDQVIEGEYIGLSCFVPYYSAIQWAPDIIWRERTIGELSVINQTTANEARFVYASTTHRDHDGRQFECAVDFRNIPEENIPVDIWGDHNKDPPTYTYASSPLILTVNYPVENLQLTNPKEVYNPGESLNITAIGKPGPSYSWLNLLNGTTVNGNILTVTKEMEGSQNWNYTAYNEIRGQRYEIDGTHSFIVEIPTTTTTQATTSTQAITTTENGNTEPGQNDILGPVLGGIFGGAVLIALVLVCFGIFMKRQIRTERRKQISALMHHLRFLENSTKQDELYCDIKDEDLDKHQVYYNESGNFGPQNKNVFLANGTLVSPTSVQQVPSDFRSDDLHELSFEPEHEYTPLERIHRRRE